MDVGQMLKSIAVSCPVTVFPMECLTKLLAVFSKEGGIRENWREFAIHAMPVGVYIITRALNVGEEPEEIVPGVNDGFVMLSENPQQKQLMMDLHAALETCPECSIGPPPPMGLLDGIILDRVWKMIIRGLKDVLSDPDRIQELLDDLFSAFENE